MTYEQKLQQEAELWGTEAQRMATELPPDWRAHRHLLYNVINHRADIDALLSRVQLGMHTLELGCASGWLSLAMAKATTAASSELALSTRMMPALTMVEEALESLKLVALLLELPMRRLRPLPNEGSAGYANTFTSCAEGEKRARSGKPDAALVAELNDPACEPLTRVHCHSNCSPRAPLGLPPVARRLAFATHHAPRATPHAPRPTRRPGWSTACSATGARLT